MGPSSGSKLHRADDDDGDVVAAALTSLCLRDRRPLAVIIGIDTSSPGEDEADSESAKNSRSARSALRASSIRRVVDA